MGTTKPAAEVEAETDRLKALHELQRDADTNYIYLGRGEVLTALSDGTPFYDNVTIAMSVRGRPDVSLVLGVEDGRPVLNKIVIERSTGPRGRLHGGPAFTAGGVHSMPFEDITRKGIAAIALAAARNSGESNEVAAVTSALGTRKRRLLSADHLRKVAEIVRDNPETPTQAVKEQMFTGYRNASRWISAAKDKGFLNEGDDTRTDLVHRGVPGDARGKDLVRPAATLDLSDPGFRLSAEPEHEPEWMVRDADAVE